MGNKQHKKRKKQDLKKGVETEDIKDYLKITEENDEAKEKTNTLGQKSKSERELDYLRNHNILNDLEDMDRLLEDKYQAFE